MKRIEKIIDKRPGIEKIIAEFTSGEAPMTPEDILIMREEAAATERAARMASQTEETELR
jgi:hypothetical protein